MRKVLTAPSCSCGLFILIVGISIWQCWYPGRSFDPEMWRDRSRILDGTRRDMAVRLVARNSLIGKTRQEVIEMLSESERADEFNPPPDLLIYQLGPSGFDSEWLSVIFGQDGKVMRCKLWED